VEFWLFLLPILLVALFVLAFPLCVGLVLSHDKPRPRIVLGEAIGVAVGLTLLQLLSLVIYDMGGEIYSTWSFRPSLVWAMYGVLGLVAFGHAIGLLGFHSRKVGKRALVPVLIHVLLGLSVWATWNLPTMVSTHGDAAMLDNFRRHEAEFNKLATMFEQDRSVTSICRRGGKYRANLPPERLAQYDELLGSVGVGQGITRDPRGPVLLRTWVVVATGYFDQSIEKGYAFLDGAPSRLVASLDNTHSLGEGLTYRHINGPWHLYYYNRDSLRASCDYGA
jgi:hypothetical protein